MHPISFLLPAVVAASPLVTQITADQPDPKQIQIVAASASGNGCPQNSYTYSISPDRTVVTLGFDKFQTYIGPNERAADRTKNCQIHLTLKYPTGFQFSTVESTYHGYAQLDKGVTGTFFSTYFFSQDASATTTTQTSITGGGVWADGQVYTKVDKVPTASYIWSPCGAQGILNVNNRLALTTTDNKASGQLTNDDATLKFTQNLQLLWRPCPK